MMAERTFAPWVEPIAAQLRQGRAEIVELAHTIPGDAWRRQSPLPGWTYKDVLGHLAVGDWVCQTVLRSVVEDRPFDMGILAELDARNARYREERLNTTVERLIAEAEAEGEETQDLLAQLNDAEEKRQQADAPMGLAEYLRMFPSHDQEHLAHLGAAREAAR